MKKLFVLILLFSAFLGFLALVLMLATGRKNVPPQAEQSKVYGWRYKMTVTLETPEGEVSGSAVREMGNDLHGSPLSQQGNPADVRGEAVVVDMGKRGVLFALISSNSDMEFYNAYKEIWPHGGSTARAIQFYDDLPTGTKGLITPEKYPGYPLLVTFTDMSDPKSVTLAQVWERQKSGLYELKQDRMEELFGEGVKLKSIELEITDEPTTWGVVDKYLPWLNEYYDQRLDGGRFGTINSLNKTANALSAGAFSTGEQK